MHLAHGQFIHVYANASINVQFFFSQVRVCKHVCMHVAILTNIQILHSVGMAPPIITYFKMCNNFSCQTYYLLSNDTRINIEIIHISKIALSR